MPKTTQFSDLIDLFTIACKENGYPQALIEKYLSAINKDGLPREAVEALTYLVAQKCGLLLNCRICDAILSKENTPLDNPLIEKAKALYRLYDLGLLGDEKIYQVIKNASGKDCRKIITAIDYLYQQQLLNNSFFRHTALYYALKSPSLTFIEAIRLFWDKTHIEDESYVDALTLAIDPIAGAQTLLTLPSELIENIIVVRAIARTHHPAKVAELLIARKENPSITLPNLRLSLIKLAEIVTKGFQDELAFLLCPREKRGFIITPEKMRLYQGTPHHQNEDILTWQSLFKFRLDPYSSTFLIEHSLVDVLAGESLESIDSLENGENKGLFILSKLFAKLLPKELLTDLSGLRYLLNQNILFEPKMLSFYFVYGAEDSRYFSEQFAQKLHECYKENNLQCLLEPSCRSAFASNQSWSPSQNENVFVEKTARDLRFYTATQPPTISTSAHKRNLSRTIP